MLIVQSVSFPKTICLLLFVSLCSCSTDISAEEQKQQEFTPIEYDNVLVQSRSEDVIVPVGYRLENSKRRIESIKQSYSLPSTRSQIAGWKNLSAINLIFHGKKDHQTHLLLKKNAFITKFDYLTQINPKDRPQYKYTGENSCQVKSLIDHSFHQLFLYTIVNQDTNQDKVLNTEDAERGYLSDLSGKSLRAITPANTKLTQWQCDFERNQLILFVREDSNGDRQFEQDNIDTLALYSYNVLDNQLSKITPPQSNLDNWQIRLTDGLIFLHTKLDTNQDGKYDQADVTRVTKYNLATKETIEINNSEIRKVLNQQQD